MSSSEASMSWPPLNSPSHVEHFRQRAKWLAPYAELISKLTTLDHAGLVFAHWSLDQFCIGTAPSYETFCETENTGILTIEHISGNRFQIRCALDRKSWFGWYKDGEVLKFRGVCYDVRGDEAVSIVGGIICDALRNRA